MLGSRAGVFDAVICRCVLPPPCSTNLDCDNLEKFLTAAGGGQKFRAGMEKGKENPYSCAVLAGVSVGAGGSLAACQHNPL